MRAGLAVPAAAARPSDGLAALPDHAGRAVRQRRLLGHGADRARRAPTATSTGAIEAKVAELGGHKSLYSDAYYDRETFAALYGGAAYRAAKDRYDPEARLTDLYDKAVGRR